MSHSPRSHSSSPGRREASSPVYAHAEDSADFAAEQLPPPYRPRAAVRPPTQQRKVRGKPGKSKRGLVALLAMLVIAVGVGTWWMRSGGALGEDSASALSPQWLNGPESVEQLDRASAMLFAGDRYVVMRTDRLARLWDAKNVAPLFENIDLQDRQLSARDDDGEGILSLATKDIVTLQPSRFSIVDDEVLLDTNVSAGAAYKIPGSSWFSSGGSWHASREFLQATMDPDRQWHGAVSHTSFDTAAAVVETDRFDPQSTQLLSHCEFDLVQPGRVDDRQPSFVYHPESARALLLDKSGYLRIIDLDLCEELELSTDSIGGAKDRVGQAIHLADDVRRIMPVDNGWWLSVFEADSGSFKSLYLSAMGVFTVGSSFALDAPLSVKQGQELTTSDLDSAYDCIEAGDRAVFAQKVDDHLQISIEGAGGAHREYLDGEHVSWLEDKAIYISDFDHALVVRDEGVELIGKDEPSHLWRIRGQKAYFAGGTLIVIDEQLGKTTFYRPRK